MTDVWTIAQYVEEHPEDYRARWRLAKKLYLAWEYRLALEHLQILRNEWTPKVNVARYLSATYYRLGRYDEAIAELQNALKTWSKDIALREQLARVLQVAERRPEAIEVWEEILYLDPDHSSAQRALKHLRAGTPPEPAQQADIALVDSDDEGEPGPGPVCPACGAQNSREFERCWQCHALLTDTEEPSQGQPAEPAPKPVAPARKQPFPIWLLGGGLSLVALVSCGLYMTLYHFAAAGGPAAESTVTDTLSALMARELLYTHALLGLALVVAWPLALWAATTVFQGGAVPKENIVITGLVLGALAYTLSWTPDPFLPFAVLAPVALSLLMAVLAFRMPIIRAVAVWVGHLLLVVAVAVLGVIALEGLEPVKEFRVLAKWGAAEIDRNAPRVRAFPPAVLPAQYTIQWDGTGSSWLDAKAQSALFEFEADPPDSPIQVEFKDREGRMAAYLGSEDRPRRFKRPIRSEQPYSLSITGPEDTQVTVTVRGLLEPALLK